MLKDISQLLRSLTGLESSVTYSIQPIESRKASTRDIVYFCTVQMDGIEPHKSLQ
jgi:hypothetical protein